MYKLEKCKKNVLMPHLIYRLLEMYAGGFEYRQDMEDITDFLGGKPEEQKETICKYAIECAQNPFLEEPCHLRKALLIQEEGEVRCRAGGLSITMLAEMTMVVYYAHFANMYDEEKPESQNQYRSELENMKDYVKRILEQDKAIRCVLRSHEYLGYYRTGTDLKSKPSFNIESCPKEEPQAEELISDGLKAVPLDCFGRSKSEQYHSYQLMDDMRDSKENVLMLDRLYEEDSCGNLVLRENHAQGWPQELLEGEMPFKDTGLFGDPEGWFCFSELLTLQKSSMVFIRPAYSANKNKGIAMRQGKYVLAWHQTEQGVDSIVLTMAEGLFLKEFNATKKKLDTKNEEQAMIPVKGEWLPLMQKKMEQAKKSRDKFELKRNRTSKEKEGKINFKVVKNLGWDEEDAVNKESRILKSQKDETEGFLLTGLLARDFCGYRHVENELRADTLIFWTNQSEENGSSAQGGKK